MHERGPLLQPAALAAAYGPERATQEAASKPSVPLDTPIAAHALTLGRPGLRALEGH